MSGISPRRPTRVTLGGRAAKAAEELGVTALQVSLSHVDAVAGACLAAVARSWGGTDGRLPQVFDDGDLRKGPAILQSPAGTAPVVPARSSTGPEPSRPPRYGRWTGRRSRTWEFRPVLMERAALGERPGRPGSRGATP